MSSRSEISSIVRASKILRCLSENITRITDISEKLQLSKGTIHGILESLVSTGFAYRDSSTRQYCIGPIIHEFASNPFVAHKRLILASYREMESLRDLSGETVGLFVLNGSQRIVLEEVLSPSEIKFTGVKGLSTPAYAGSSGKVLLAELSQEDLQLLLKNLTLLPAAPNTVTEKTRLLRELAEIRKRGYSTSFSERVVGSASIAAPIKNYSCPASLSIVGPENRLSLKKMLSFLNELKKSTARIAKSLKEHAQREA
jgi:IclR family transcriptional regulator, KDG regulon repressor